MKSEYVGKKEYSVSRVLGWGVGVRSLNTLKKKNAVLVGY